MSLCNKEFELCRKVISFVRSILGMEILQRNIARWEFPINCILFKFLHKFNTGLKSETDYLSEMTKIRNDILLCELFFVFNIGMIISSKGSLQDQHDLRISEDLSFVV
jgi:hypothetical protein